MDRSPAGSSISSRSVPSCNGRQTENKVQLANIYELLREAGHDDALYARSVPRSELDESKTFAAAQAARMGWMTDSAITQAFLANPIEPDSVPASIELHGLPMSQPEAFGPFVVQRFQRTALQHWVEQVEGGPPRGHGGVGQ